MSKNEIDFLNPTMDLLEDYIRIGGLSSSIFVPSSLPPGLIENLQAAVCAHTLGVGMDYAKKRYVQELTISVSKTYEAFRNLYSTGKLHMRETVDRMAPVDEPSAGEVYSDASLNRLESTYYSAALLYKEGRLIDAHILSRFMLEQIAWSFAVCEVNNYHEAIKIQPSKAISVLKKVIPSVGVLYGKLCKYVHLPIEKHFEFITINEEKTKVVMGYGLHACRQGAVLGILADLCGSVYEYTQRRHYEQLLNWVNTPDGLRLNEDRPFNDRMNSLLIALNEAYQEESEPYEEFIRRNWIIRDDFL